MIKKIISALNLVSACACFVIGALLSIELGFDVSVENRELFSRMHTVLILYFLADTLCRILLSKNIKNTILSRILDALLIIPLVGKGVPGLPLFDNYLVVQILLLFVMMGRLPHVNGLFRKLKFNPAQIFLIGFLLAIIIGSLFLSLPLSRSIDTHLSFIDAIFTATSAICVTGLVTQDIGYAFSGFGQSIILVLIQLGGIGIMTFYALLTIVLNRKMSHNETSEYQETLLSDSATHPFAVIKYIIGLTIILESIGVLLLFSFWKDDFESPIKAFLYAVFHSISAFCNAGFSLFPNSLAGYVDQPSILITIALLIILGGIGFPVIFNIMNQNFKHFQWRRLRVQTKIPIVVTSALILVGMVLIYFGESQNALVDYGFKGKLLMSFFHSVSSRTAGFQAMSLTTFHVSTLWVLIILMFIGASPGSTGGGIKTTTFGLMFASLRSTLQGESRVEWFGRTITMANTFKAMSIITVSLSTIGLFFYVLLWFEDLPFMSLLFEAISAFGTVGFSLDVTPQLSTGGKVALIVLMFLGRVGPLTFAYALSSRKPKPNYAYPEEKILLG